MSTLYLECNAGISGDMTVAALLDLGADSEGLFDALGTMPVDGYEITVSRVLKAGIDCKDFDVKVEEENHDHDMEYLHGHHHDNHHDHHHDYHHEHRNLYDVIEIIDRTEITDNAKKIAKEIFEIVAKAESKAHNKPIDKVHFHEVGALDSIIDIISVAYCLDDLNIDKVIVPYLSEGSGTVRCAHGILPIPVPAVEHIAKDHNIKLKRNGFEGEFVTPTGAAIVAAIRTSDKLPSEMKIIKTGMGAGKREYELASILRAMIIEDKDEGSIYKLETNVDDCTGEALAYTVERLMEAGARDAHYSPVFMKKNRPGWVLNVICDEEDIEKMEKIIFKETTTIGIRKIKLDRTTLPREIIEVETEYGKARVKVCELEDETRYYPEYEDVAKLARENDIAFMEMYEVIKNSVV